jgi:hypothetical protein
MKKQILTLIFAAITVVAVSQTATNFTANDCAGTSHDLFTELNAGKVIVLVWVMPCGACTGASLTTYNVVQSYAAGNPNKVFMYVCDDYGNTNCTSLDTWANSTGLPNALRFSNSAINMADYGSTGMPKIVVIGGPNHTVFYNSNNTVNATALQSAIDDAISSTTGITVPASSQNGVSVMPNPAKNSTVISCNIATSSEITVEIFSLEGKLIETVFSGQLAGGENKFNLNLNKYSDGVYMVRLTEGDITKTVKFTVAR